MRRHIAIRNSARNARAFTLIELVFVMGLAAIVFFLGIPSYNSFRQNRASASAAMQFLFDARRVRQLCMNIEETSDFTIRNSSASPPNTYSYEVPGEGRTISRNIQDEYLGASIAGAGGSRFRIDEGGNYTREGVADAIVPNPDPGGVNFMYVSFFSGGGRRYDVRLFVNGESDIRQIN